MKSGSAAAAVEQTKPSIKISAHHKGAGFAAERVYTNHNNVLDNVDACKKKPLTSTSSVLRLFFYLSSLFTFGILNDESDKSFTPYKMLC